MGDSGGRKRSKKSKRSKRNKAEKKNRRSEAVRPVEQAPPQSQADTTSDMVLSDTSQAVVIELQRTELSRLLREQQRLNDRVDQLLRLHEREQVLRQQMQASLDQLSARRALPPRSDTASDQDGLAARVHRAEGKFAALQNAVGRLVALLERQTASAQ